jgi:hypothetical protein
MNLPTPMRNTLVVEIYQTFKNLIHYVLSLSFDKTTLPLRVARNVSEEIAAGAELKKYLPRARTE